MAAVRAVDPRFADLPALDDVWREVAREFDPTPVLAGSWIQVMPTFDTITENTFSISLGGSELGLGQLVEVMLVDGCVERVEDPALSPPPSGAPGDPCQWRHSWAAPRGGDRIAAGDGRTTIVPRLPGERLPFLSGLWDRPWRTVGMEARAPASGDGPTPGHPARARASVRWGSIRATVRCGTCLTAEVTADCKGHCVESSVAHHAAQGNASIGTRARSLTPENPGHGWKPGWSQGTATYHP